MNRLQGTWNALAKVVTLTLVLFGLVQLGQWSWGSIGGVWGALALFAVAALLLGSRKLWIYLYNPLVYRFFAVPRFDDCKVLDSEATVTIGEDGDTIVDTWRTYIYDSVPKRWNLFDTLQSNEGFEDVSIPDVYHSEDAVPRKWMRKAQDRMVVYWAPKEGSIEALVPYRHHFRWHPSDNLGEDVNYFLWFRLFRVRRFRASIRTSRPITSVWAAWIPKGFAGVDAEVLELRNAPDVELVPQPAISEDAREMSWTIEAPEYRFGYVVCWSHV